MCKYVNISYIYIWYMCFPLKTPCDWVASFRLPFGEFKVDLPRADGGHAIQSTPHETPRITTRTAIKRNQMYSYSQMKTRNDLPGLLVCSSWLSNRPGCNEFGMCMVTVKACKSYLWISKLDQNWICDCICISYHSCPFCVGSHSCGYYWWIVNRPTKKLATNGIVDSSG